MNNATRGISSTLLALAAIGTANAAQDGAATGHEAPFPDRAITIVVPFPPGGTADALARLIAPRLQSALGTPIVVENHSGASGMVGAGYVARAKPDGYTLLVATPPILSVNQWLYKTLPYDPEKDFAPVTDAVQTSNMIVVPPNVPARTLAELVALAKARPGVLNFASGGNGTSHHLCGEMLKKAAGIDMVHVPYKGVGPAQIDLLGGRITMMCDNISNVIAHVRSGKLRALAVTAAERSPLAPEVPTTAEAGFPGLDASVWFSFVAPAGTPAPVVNRLNAEIANALADKSVAARLQALGLTVVADSPEHFGRFVSAESARLGELVRASGAKAD
ncbi:MAG TPA: tripartite tricarboxylate transporter substrate binding protein [Usitatibacter sp.]|nr:tripartite tricarboxylate transporter substrate binding protein [Usitatibacter sp.]